MYRSRWTRLALAVVALAGMPAGAQAALINPTVVFAEDASQLQTRMTLAFDGTHYWSVTGGNTGGIREAQYTAGGAFLANYSPGLDFRSIFADAGGDVFARAFNNRTIYQQTAPGVFTPVTMLVGGALDAQSAVVLNGAETEYLAANAGIVSRWSLAGNFLGSINLVGFGSLAGENTYPANRGIAASGNYLFTYNSGTLSTWDLLGNRLTQDTLVGAGNTFDANFSYSIANDLFFVESGGFWRGYDIGLRSAPEPATLLLVGLGLGTAVRRRILGRSTSR